MTDNRTTELHGTLTAEQVMAIAGRHQPDYCSDTHVCFDWQAIADELNAELGSGECENEWESSGGFRCSECLTEIVSTEANYPMPMEFRFCPNCGKAVEK